VEGSAQNLLHDPIVAGIVANFRDITERKQAEEKLQSSERYFRSLTQNALDVTMVIGRDGIIKYATSSVEPPRGYKPEEIIDTNGFSTVHPEDLPKAMNAYNDLMQNPATQVRTEVRVLHKDGSWRIVEGVARNLLDDPIVEGIIVSYRDVTERRQAAEKLEELYRQEKDLRQQLETEMKRRVEFTRALAHELKTPLTPMLISSQVLASELKEEPLLSLARNISRGASNLNSRIDELLDLAKGEIGMLQLKIEQLDALQLLREVVEYVSPVASSRGQSLIMELPDSLPLVRADNVRLRQIVLNLLNNALNYTPEGGRIALRAGQKDANLIVEVEDNGPGIAEEEQQHMFEPYHRMEVAGERLSGLGLGLALCKMLVDLHGGQIWVKSRVGEGSTFSFSLPLEAANK
jgi:PAS domain S-box-containing protein